MEKLEGIKNSINGFVHFNLVDSVIVIVVSIIIYKILVGVFSSFFKIGSLDDRISKKSKTYLRLTRSITRYVFIVLDLLIVLQINNFDVSSMLAGVGVAGVIISLAIQDTLKDIIRGISVLSDNYFQVGDVIKVGDALGKVKVIGIKSTRIEDLVTGDIITLANRNLETVEVMSKLIYINIPMPYELSVEEGDRIANEIIEEIKHNPNVEGTRYLGVNAFEDSYINYLIEVTAPAVKRLQTRRDALGTILRILEKNGIRVPYKQIDIHNK